MPTKLRQQFRLPYEFTKAGPEEQPGINQFVDSKYFTNSEN